MLLTYAILTEVSEGDGVAQAVDLGDAVLPLRARRATEQIGRAWLRGDRRALPRVADLPPQSEYACRDERDPDDFAEHSLVLVPADARARSVFRDEHLLE